MKSGKMTTRNSGYQPFFFSHAIDMMGLETKLKLLVLMFFRFLVALKLL